jgi:nucleoside-diphosphate-sugar epimerase
MGSEGPVLQNQQTPYARAKAQAEHTIATLFDRFTIIRPTNYFGADQPRRLKSVGESHVIPDLLHKIHSEPALEILGDGSQIRNFIHVSDVSNFIQAALQTDAPRYVNLRSNLFLSIRELAIQLLEWSKKEKELKFAPQFLKYEPQPIKDFSLETAQSLGWTPKIQSLFEGLALRLRPKARAATTKMAIHNP